MKRPMRGDIVVALAPGAYGKPRPAVVVQADIANEIHSSIVVCLVTSLVVDAPLYRITLPASNSTGLQNESQIMVDKLVALPVEKLKQIIGRVDDTTMVHVNRLLVMWLGLS